jgi:hypothetical protein
MLWAIWGMTYWTRVTVNPALGMLVWDSYAFGLRWRTVTRVRGQIESIETVEIQGLNYWYYDFIVRGSADRRVLFSGTKNSRPWVVRETAGRLGIPLEPLKKSDE